LDAAEEAGGLEEDDEDEREFEERDGVDEEVDDDIPSALAFARKTA